jgi:putative transport protein
VLGVATDAINQLPKSAEEKKRLLDAMPVAYAVTYLFGTAGSAWFLASIGPKLLGGNVVEECRKLESEMGGGEVEAGVVSAYARFVARAYRVADARFFGKHVEEFEQHLASLPGHRRAFVERVRHNGGIEEATPATMLREGDVIAVAGQRDLLLEVLPSIGPEVNDPQVLDFQAEVLDVVITSREFDGKTLREIVNSIEGSLLRGVFLRRLLRLGQEMPVSAGSTLQRGDVAQIVGSRGNVERVAKVLGYPDRPTDRTNVEMMGLGIAVGALAGALSITVGQIPLSLSTSGGALLGGLVCGWLRSVNRTFGRIPAPALWVLNNIGLSAFIAVVGITAGPSFVSGLKSSGLSLLAAGVFVTCMPLVVGLLAGRFIFRFHPAITLGACAGARATTAALGAIQDACKSKVPAVGYTVPYAVGNMLLITWGVVIVALLG